MKFGICNEMFVDQPFDQAFATARECGYTGIELAPFTMGTDAPSISDSERAIVRQQAAAAGLEVIGLHWLLAKTEGYYLTSPDATIRENTAEYLRQLSVLCADLGGKVMVLGSPQQRNLLPGVTHQDAMKYAAEVIAEAEPTFAECDVTLAIEPLGPAEGDFLNTRSVGSGFNASHRLAVRKAAFGRKSDEHRRTYHSQDHCGASQSYGALSRQ